ncbi:Hypothetical predicted protein [Paramuricea clavata]|uniref:Uncharacterized protein n=1 Tax=Paramuricea clavata TaxID=317549 RepID=A0A7D9DN48_PARCT|nr:Hypothetical predicted protein [Paramuricea clavata]
MTILTGGVLVLTAGLKKPQFLKYISLCCVLITMVLAQGVIIIEGFDATFIHTLSKNDPSCEDFEPERHRLECVKFKEAYRLSFTLIFITDIVLVLCVIVVLLLFADWILFVAPKTLQRNEQAVHEIPPPQQERYYVAMPTERYQRTWNSQHDQSTIPLHPM